MAPRSRERVLANLESLNREAFEQAEEAGDEDERRRLGSACQRCSRRPFRK